MEDFDMENKNFDTWSILTLIKAKEKGKLKFPIYQRDAVWGPGRICALWDSLLRGFPLPSFLVIKGGKTLSREIDSQSWGKATDPALYNMLDGQQRFRAIESGYIYNNNKDIRLWLDLAPPAAKHPFNFKYWLHACDKIFPFGYEIGADAEYKFKLLTDKELRELWLSIQNFDSLRGRAFYELPLDKTCPYKAHCPVPLDALVKLISGTEENRSNLNSGSLEQDITKLAKKITELAEEYAAKTEALLKEPKTYDCFTIRTVAAGLMRLSKYKIVIQVINLDNIDIEDDGEFTLYERIGRAGVEITNRQLAVSRLILQLGKEGNDAIDSFQRSPKLHCLLDTEDIVHGIARVAFAVSQSRDGEYDMGESEESKYNRDLVDLTTNRLQAIQKDKPKWDSFIRELRKYCNKISSSEPQPLIQKCFEQLYETLLYHEKNNPNGFALVQLSQPGRLGEGISPITLHPLLFWFIACSEGQEPEKAQREDMLRWLLFANGLINDPKNLKLNRDVFQKVVRERGLDFSKIYKFVMDDDDLRINLGLVLDQPDCNEKNEIVRVRYDPKDLPEPNKVTELTARNFLLGNWAQSRVNRFLLLWNQRKAMEHFYGKINYIPALFSKGKPFELDHIVARGSFLHQTDIKAKNIEAGIHNLFSLVVEDEVIVILKALIANRDNWHKGIGDTLRLSFTNLIGNYRYWPKMLNRADQDDPVKDKLGTKLNLNNLAGHPLQEKFAGCGEDLICSWSALPISDKNIWYELPPSKWTDNEGLIGKFIWAILKREFFLYEKAYKMIKQS